MKTFYYRSINSNSIVPIPLKIHADGALYPGQPYKWNQDQQKYRVEKNLISGLAIIIQFVFMFMSIYSAQYYSKRQNLIKMAYTLFTFSYTYGAGSVFYCLVTRASEAAAFLNGCRTVEYSFRQKGTELVGSTIEVLIVKGFRITASIIPVLYSIGTLILPCFPVNFFSALLTQCQTPTSQVYDPWSQRAEVIASTIISSIVYLGALNAGFAAITHLVVGFQFHLQSLTGCKRCLDSNRKTDVIVLYRQLQILNGLFNIAHKGVLISALIALAVAEECAAYVIVRAPNSVLPASVKVGALIMMVWMVFITLVVYGFAGTIHTTSKNIIGKALSKHGGLNNRELKLGLKSCPPLKIIFGGSNFFEKETPLKCFEFSVERFVDLLIMERQWKHSE